MCVGFVVYALENSISHNCVHSFIMQINVKSLKSKTCSATDTPYD